MMLWRRPTRITPSRPIAAQTASFPSAFSIPAVKPSSAFTAFSGTTSAFSIVSSPSSTSLKPVWCSDLVRPGPTDVGSGKAEIKPEAIAVSIDTSPEIAGAASVPAVQSGDALASHSYAKGVQNTLTGEEQERVVTELKGAKVFIKRGDREFTDGILGHVKLLSHEISGEERILFRREPVWKVSMSVRLRPTVRCTFDRAQSTLRVTLKETEEQEGVPHEQWPQHMVIYAIKRGKATKSDFEEFARGVIASTHLSLSSLDGTT
ncbi:hypothetical protein OBBRIDRAFT_153076 [Obba rivulosa]|uniref:RanBD1 domain-containing protein n=1 Tax=Obba rivulosa TaxID=1052685 RepID=A0A8E2AN14_9APHY|nr:hypothetical protein OBBRIDRAFT_153076 [Obba rivulosa]